MLCTTRGMTGTPGPQKWHHKREKGTGDSPFSTSVKAASSARGSFSLVMADVIPTSTPPRSLLDPWLKRCPVVPWSEVQGRCLP